MVCYMITYLSMHINHTHVLLLSELAPLPAQLPAGLQFAPVMAFVHEEIERSLRDRSALLLPVSPDSAAI